MLSITINIHFKLLNLLLLHCYLLLLLISITLNQLVSKTQV